MLPKERCVAAADNQVLGANLAKSIDGRQLRPIIVAHLRTRGRKPIPARRAMRIELGSRKGVILPQRPPRCWTCADLSPPLRPPQFSAEQIKTPMSEWQPSANGNPASRWSAVQDNVRRRRLFPDVAKHADDLAPVQRDLPRAS